MPVRGRRPKPAGQAVTRHRSALEWLEVVNEPFAGEVPKLPARRAVMTPFGPKQVPLQALTRRWWESVSTMPHCVLWTRSDWAFALATALVADAAFAGGVGAATELRNREKVLGTTVDYRRSLRIRYVPAVAETPPGVTSLDEYRDL